MRKRYKRFDSDAAFQTLDHAYRSLDGCYDCNDLADCVTRFYALGNDANAVKTMAMFIWKHGKKELASVLDNLHKKYDFQKIQEILRIDVDLEDYYHIKDTKKNVWEEILL